MDECTPYSHWYTYNTLICTWSCITHFHMCIYCLIIFMICICILNAFNPQMRSFFSHLCIQTRALEAFKKVFLPSLYCFNSLTSPALVCSFKMSVYWILWDDWFFYVCTYIFAVSPSGTHFILRFKNRGNLKMDFQFRW